jgi:pyruvate dehydrogenase E2 component (dihydrolipoamide acetyltransferase)
MAEQQVSVPNIGDASDVAVVEVLVQPGARVELEQPLVVLESDKASMEIPSPLAGVVKSITVKVGDSVSEGSALLVIDADGAGDAKPAPEPTAAKASPAAPAATPPAKPAEPPKSKEPSDGAQAQPAEPSSAPDEAAPEAERKTEIEPQTRTFPPAPEPSSAHEPKQAGALPHASPAIRRFARELGVDLARVEGSGKHGRITKEDLQRYVKQALTAGSAAGVGLSIAAAPEIDFKKFGPIELVALTKIQRVSGKNLHRSWVTIPHVTQFDDADITELEAFRKKLKAEQPKLKLTLLCFFMKAVVSALKAMPRFNSSLDKSGENLVVKGYYHIGVAVDTPNGLVVPAIRDVDQKSLSQLAKDLEDVSERARTRKLMPNDLQGASFTISSLGGIGGTKFTPIINPPEVAVLGVSRAQIRPIYEDGAFVPRLICPVSLSYDHRVIDGADGARFTKRLCELLSDIRQLLL